MPEFTGLFHEGFLLFEAEGGGMTFYLSEARRVFAGQPDPKSELGWMNEITWRRVWNRAFGVRYIQGHSIYNATRMYLSNPAVCPALNGIKEGMENYLNGELFTDISTRYLEDGSYFRIDYVTLGYDLRQLTDKWFSGLRVYAGVSNLLTITGFTGLDPAIEYSHHSIETDYLTGRYGIDHFNTYPLARTWFIGINYKY